MIFIEKLRITPGPWCLKRWRNDFAMRIFSGNTYLGSVYNSDMDKNQIKRNANIIALAPEMLEVLIQNVLNEKGIDCDYEISIIEKATGKTWEEIKELL